MLSYIINISISQSPVRCTACCMLLAAPAGLGVRLGLGCALGSQRSLELCLAHQHIEAGHWRLGFPLLHDLLHGLAEIDMKQVMQQNLKLRTMEKHLPRSHKVTDFTRQCQCAISQQDKNTASAGPVYLVFDKCCQTKIWVRVKI